MGWRRVKLDQLGKVERGRSRHRPRDDPKLYGGPHPFIQTGDVKASGFRITQFRQTYSTAGLEQSRLWPAGTLCITIAANICDTAILAFPACFPDSIVGFTPYSGVSDVAFVKYALDLVKQQFTAISRGATQDNLSLEKLLSQELSVPDVEEQRRIASILGAYDDLIEVNRRRIAVLEAMARGLFEEWFVRFRFPGHEGVEIVDTPEGRLPVGWERAALPEIASINARSIKSKNGPDNIGYIDIASVSPGQVDSVAWLPLAEAPSRARRLVQDGSILWSTVRPNRRSFALLLSPAEDVIASTGFAVIDAISVPFSYLYHAMTTDEFVGYLVGNATGSAYPAVTSVTFERARFIVPDAALLRDFHSAAEPKLRLSANLRLCNDSLAAARDLLLPRLISGELSLGAASRHLEAAA